MTLAGAPALVKAETPIEALRKLVAAKGGVPTVAPRCKEVSANYIYRIVKGTEIKDDANIAFGAVCDIIQNGCGVPLADFFRSIDPEDQNAELWDLFKESLMDDRKETVAGLLRSLKKLKTLAADRPKLRKRG